MILRQKNYIAGIESARSAMKSVVTMKGVVTIKSVVIYAGSAINPEARCTSMRISSVSCALSPMNTGVVFTE